MSKPLALTCLLLALTPLALALTPSTELFLPSVGHGQGSCPGGVCSEWRTDVWVLNSADVAATVEVSFLVRDADNSDPVSETLTLSAGETRELTDVMLSLFGIDDAFGALRFEADREVVVCGRIYDANVQTNLGTGTAGQFFAALPAAAAIPSGQSTDLVGLARDEAGEWRTNFGLVETTGEPATVAVELLDGSGATLATATYEVAGLAVDQLSLADVGGPQGTNQRLRLSVTAGSGRVLTFASRIDNRTGDPSTVEMVIASMAPRSTGRFSGVVMSSDGLRVDGGLELGISSAGLEELAGATTIPCGDESFTVDFGTPPTNPVPIAADGSFTITLTIPYVDGAIPIFTIDWTLTGTLDSSGAASGTLRSDTHDGLGYWTACNGTSDRGWHAGWTGEYAR